MVSSIASIQAVRIEVEDGQEYLSRSMTALVFAAGSVTARCAVKATSAHVFNIHATRSRRSMSGQGFPVSHTVACVVAACSSAAAASMVILFTLVDRQTALQQRSPG